jgi:hypothetical protein
MPVVDSLEAGAFLDRNIGRHPTAWRGEAQALGFERLALRPLGLIES